MKFIDKVYSMNISQIRYFLAVAEAGSFTRAAERANVTQPTLSAGIKRLESELGAILLDRGRGSALTPAGARLLPHARVMLQEWTAARRDLRQAKPARQRLRLGHVPALPTSGITHLLGGFLVSQPDVAVETLEAPAVTLRRRLDMGRIDIALVPADPGDTEQNSQPLFRLRYRLALPTGHPLAQRAGIRLQDLHDQPFAICPQSAVMPEAERLFASHNIRPHIVGRTESEGTLLALVEGGLGLALLPAWLLAEARERVASQAIPELRLVLPFHLAWRAPAGSATLLFTAHAASHGWLPEGPVLGH